MEVDGCCNAKRMKAEMEEEEITRERDTEGEYGEKLTSEWRNGGLASNGEMWSRCNHPKQHLLSCYNL
eukprot:590380-Pelagomonas_calceolata.AAC.2